MSKIDKEALDRYLTKEQEEHYEDTFLLVDYEDSSLVCRGCGRGLAEDELALEFTQCCEEYMVTRDIYGEYYKQDWVLKKDPRLKSLTIMIVIALVACLGSLGALLWIYGWGAL